MNISRPFKLMTKDEMLDTFDEYQGLPDRYYLHGYFGLIYPSMDHRPKIAAYYKLYEMGRADVYGDCSK